MLERQKQLLDASKPSTDDSLLSWTQRSWAPTAYTVRDTEAQRGTGKWPKITWSPELRVPVSQAINFLDPRPPTQAITDAW